MKTGTINKCNSPNCRVDITVDITGNEPKIVADPETLEVAHRDNHGRQPVNIHFNLNTTGYSFAQDGIKFADETRAKRQFSRDAGAPDPTHIKMKDKNTKEDDEEFEYSIKVKDKDGKVITKDPVIINGRR